MKTLKAARYMLEAAFLYMVLAVFGLLSPDMASAIGGWIGRTVGPRLAASRKALANIGAAFPDLDAGGQQKILAAMWDNLGRVIAEYPHIKTLACERTNVANLDLVKNIPASGKPAIVISAHLANWEICGAAALMQGGVLLDLVYRAPNNPYVDRLLARARVINPDLRTMPKSKTGARSIVRSLMEKRPIGILIDQKYNEGIPALFFDRPAMTSPAFVELAQKFDCPLILARLERTGGAHFRIGLVEIPTKDDNGAPLPVDRVIAAAHGYLEAWIRERPGQWLWLHRRWSDRAERDYARLKNLPPTGLSA